MRIKVIETFENDVLMSVEVQAARRILYFSACLNPIKCFYFPPIKPGGKRRISRECNDINPNVFNKKHKKFIEKMKKLAIKKEKRIWLG